MNTELLKKIIFIMLVGGGLFGIESLFYEASQFTVFHHLGNGVLCVLILAVVTKTKWGVAFFAKKQLTGHDNPNKSDLAKSIDEK